MVEIQENINKILIAEFTGTFLIALSNCLPHLNQEESIITRTFQLLTGIFLAIFIMRKISSYFNPAVYFMFYKLKNTEFLLNNMPSIFLYQCLGGILGYYFVYKISNGKLFNLCITNNNIVSICVGEFFCSFLFYLLIVVNADKENNLTQDPVISTIEIACGIGLGNAIGGKLSNAGMNPAIALGSSFVSYIHTGDIKDLRNLWIYILFPMLAGVMAKYFYVEIMKNGKNSFDELNNN